MDYKKIFKETYHNGDIDSLENAISLMKENGASQIDCVKVLKNELNLTLSEADGIVLNAKAWSQEKESVEKFRDHFFRLAIDLSKGEDSVS